MRTQEHLVDRAAVAGVAISGSQTRKQEQIQGKPRVLGWPKNIFEQKYTTATTALDSHRWRVRCVAVPFSFRARRRTRHATSTDLAGTTYGSLHAAQ